MPNQNNCTGGQIGTLQVPNLDCSCISISSIAWNTAGTQFTITLSNGQSITSPVLTGATGAAPTVSFRVLGTELQYSINGGTTWTSIYDFSALIEGVLHNDITNSATTGTALEILKTYTIPANKLATDGSYLIVRARFSTSTATTPTSTKTVGIYFNGSAVITGTFTAANIDVFEYEVWINRYSNTIVKIKASSAAVYAVFPIVAGAALTGFANTGGLNLTTTTYDITARANSDVIGDLTCENLTVTYFKK